MIYICKLAIDLNAGIKELKCFLLQNNCYIAKDLLRFIYLNDDSFYRKLFSVLKTIIELDFHKVFILISVLLCRTFLFVILTRNEVQ